jgi:hypothetical protein
VARKYFSEIWLRHGDANRRQAVADANAADIGRQAFRYRPIGQSALDWDR